MSEVMTDAIYQERRNRLIPLAKKYADSTIRPILKPKQENDLDLWYGRWTRLFCDRMTVLAVNAKLQDAKSLRPDVYERLKKDFN